MIFKIDKNCQIMILSYHNTASMCLDIPRIGFDLWGTLFDSIYVLSNNPPRRSIYKIIIELLSYNKYISNKKPRRCMNFLTQK